MRNTKEINEMISTIAENLKTYREAAALPIKTLSIKSNIPEQTIAAIENGDKEAYKSFPTLIQLTETLDIRFEDLLEKNNQYLQYYKVPLYFYEYFAEKQKKLNINTKQLVKAVGIDTRELYYWRYGRKIPKPDKLQNMLVMLKINANELKRFEDKYKTIINTETETKEQTTSYHQASTKQNTNENVNIPAKKTTDEPINEIIKAYKFYKNKEKCIAELNRIIHIAEALKKELEE